MTSGGDRFWRGALIAGYGLFFLCGVLVQIDSYDVWWHLHIGRYIVSTHTIPTVDHFTRLGDGRPYLDSHWLFQVLLYLLTRLFGTVGLSVYQAVVYGLLFLSYLLIPRRGRDRLSGLVITLSIGAIGICAISSRFLPRPEAITYLMITSIILIFELYRRRKTRLVYFIPFLMLLWENCHALFVIGYFLIGAYLIDSVLARFRPERFSGNPSSGL